MCCLSSMESCCKASENCCGVRGPVRQHQACVDAFSLYPHLANGWESAARHLIWGNAVSVVKSSTVKGRRLQPATLLQLLCRGEAPLVVFPKPAGPETHFGRFKDCMFLCASQPAQSALGAACLQLKCNVSGGKGGDCLTACHVWQKKTYLKQAILGT